MKPKVQFSNVLGLEDAKKQFKSILLQKRIKHIYKSDLKWCTNCFLLRGPPGTGKTLLAEAVAGEFQKSDKNCRFFAPKANNLLDKYQGGAENKIHALFDVAKENSKRGSLSIIFIDEIEAMLQKRSESKTSSITQQFLVELNDVLSNSNNNIIFIGAMNTSVDIDEAALNRFQIIDIPLPDYESRKNMIYNLMLTIPNSLSEEDYKSISKKTEAFSGRSINICVTKMLGTMANKLYDARFFYEENGSFYMCEENHPNAIQMRFDDFIFDEKIVPPLITFEDLNTEINNFLKQLKEIPKNIHILTLKIEPSNIFEKMD